MTLGEAFESRRSNSLNAMRLLLAGCVLISHSWHIGGYGPEPGLMGWTIGTWALIGFFGISGYLVTMSRLRHSSSIRYIQARALRILPGLWVCVAVTAFVIAPTTAALSGRRYSVNDAGEFALRNALLLAGPLGPQPIGGTLAGIPDGQLWNGPLWTLFWEAFCYLIVGFCGALFRYVIFRLAVSLLFAIGTSALVAANQVEALSYWAVNGPIAPLTAFFAGAMIFCFRTRVVIKAKTFVMLLTFIAAGAIFGLKNYLLIATFILLILMLAFLLPLKNLGSKYDISYGVYVYGWPLQQCLALAGLHLVTSAATFSAISLCATLPLAVLSALLVEGPAQRFARRRNQLERAQGPPAPQTASRLD